jgi:signal transduction histidine kinase
MTNPKRDQVYAYSSKKLNAINYGFEFVDKALGEKYLIFRIASTPPLYTLLVASFLSVGCIFYWGMVLNDVASAIPVSLAIFSFIFAILLMWVIVFLRYYQQSLQDQQYKYLKLLQWVESVTMVGLVITTGFVVVARSSRHCTSFGFSDIWSCVPVPSHVLSIGGDIALVMVSLPFILSVGFPCIPVFVTFISLAIAIIFVISLLIYLNSFLPSTIMIVAILLNLLILIFSRLQNMQLFFYCEKYYHMIDEQAQQEKKMSDKINEEMRNLIASVSHDLKSVSSFFLMF